ncbi:MAG: tetratricopeptide repeat protein [Selenomonadaceae bacterium]|nr:tetratricopeptide repeat protein [Selenomonadaceae bacterium]
MTFFLIVPSVIVVSIILVHSVTNYLGLKIKYGALFLCTVLALVSLFVAMEISPNPDENFFIRLGAMILVSATLVTLLNRFLLLREIEDEANFTEVVRKAYSKKSEEELSSSEVAKERLITVSESHNEVETSKSETLEELVEYAKAEMEQGNYSAAVDAYEKALEEYPDDDYAPFVAIDLSAIYREQAAYTKAIQIYEEALTFSAVKENPAVKDEFLKKLAYLKTVQSVLLKHRALSTPFSEIPQEYLKEIELEFKENSLAKKISKR